MKPEQRLKLNPLNDEERQILRLVVEDYYVVLPPALQVHSLFATHILSRTLHRFGIRTRVLPCRLWCSSLRPPMPNNRETVGGVVNYWDTEKWNGHVVCLVGDWLVDVALYHLNPGFNYEVPKLIARRIVRPEPGIYARYQLNKQTEFIWYRLPAKTAAVSVAGYEDVIDRFVDDLSSHIRRLLGYEDDLPAEESIITSEELTAEDDEIVLDEESASPAASSAEEETASGDELTNPTTEAVALSAGADNAQDGMQDHSALSENKTEEIESASA
jgi:hypothetical protein